MRICFFKIFFSQIEFSLFDFTTRKSSTSKFDSFKDVRNQLKTYKNTYGSWKGIHEIFELNNALFQEQKHRLRLFNKNGNKNDKPEYRLDISFELNIPEEEYFSEGQYL